MFDVEKVIRVLGYIVYVALWSPVIVLAHVIVPPVLIALYLRAGLTFREAINICAKLIYAGIQHDANFIQTGKW